MTRYDIIRSLVRDQVSKGNIGTAEQILVSADECNLCTRTELNHLSTEHGLSLMWHTTAEEK
jgi:hypothetical protein